MISGVDFGVAAGITTTIQLAALGSLILFQLLFSIFFFRRKKQESEEKLKTSKLEQQAEQAARDERLTLTERYTKSIAGLNATLKELNISVREVSDHVKHMQGLMDEKMSILIDEYIGELSLPMVHELVNLIFSSARDRVLIFCNEIIKNNHILENEIEVKRRIKFFIQQEYQKDHNRLRIFKYKSIPICSGMNMDWRQTLIDGIESRIMDVQNGDQIAARNLDNFIKDSFESFKNELKEKIDSL